MSADRPLLLRWIEWALLAIGAVCLTYYGFQTIEARHVQREQMTAFEEVLESRAVAPVVTPAPKDVTVPEALRRALPNDQSSAISHDSAARAANVMALLEIPRLRLSSAVVAGDDADVLDVAVGHLPDTPKPWEDGNSALAAHRDGLFRPLKHIKVGDEVRVRSEQGEFVYRVRETKVVTPDDLSVLAPTSTATLTLITCYPFNFIGAAPKRFIVHADRVESSLSPH